MDDSETLHRRARLRELVNVHFGGEQKNLLAYILSRTGKAANQGELSLLMKDNSGNSFGDKKARTLTEQIGLDRRWFDMPVRSGLDSSGPKVCLTPHVTQPAAVQEPHNDYSVVLDTALELAKQAQEIGQMWLALAPDEKQRIKALIKSLVHSESDQSDSNILDAARRQISKQVHTEG